MNADFIIDLLDNEPHEWVFGEHVATYKPTGKQIWTSNGWYCIDIHPADNGVFNLVEKWRIMHAIRAATVQMFAITKT